MPALSLQSPPTVIETPSGPANVLGASHESTPDVASVPKKLTISGWLYQPFASAGREGEAVTCGAVASYLTTNEPLALLPARSRHKPLTTAAALSGPE